VRLVFFETEMELKLMFNPILAKSRDSITDRIQVSPESMSCCYKQRKKYCCWLVKSTWT